MIQIIPTSDAAEMISIIIPVYRNATSALDLIDALLQQELPAGTPLEVIVVDDGSGDGSSDLLRKREDQQVRLVALPRNMGRSVARNVGARHASGQFLFFIDCDCRPASRKFLATHLRLLGGGCIASCGPVTGNGHDFWSRYQDDVSGRRMRRHEAGAGYSGSTQNFAVEAKSYRRTDGFDVRYTEYGFEDRDLLVRLSRLGPIAWSTEAVVEHLDSLSLPAVLNKVTIAAGRSAALFSGDHMTAYRALGYAAIDTRLHAWLRPIALLLKPALGTAPTVDRMLGHPWLPYGMAKAAVKALTALAYMYGTAVTPVDRP